MDDDVLGAFRRSRFRSLAEDRLAALAQGSRRVNLPRGGQHHRDGEAVPPALVISGLIRIFITAPDGRQVTVRYAREGDLLGIAPTFSPIPATGATEALTQVGLLIFDTKNLVALARHDILVANVLLVEASERSVSFTAEIAGTYFPSMRQRVVRHLLDLSSAGPGQEIVTAVTQQELADSVGSLREVVVRILRDLREEGLIETGRNSVKLLDPVRLHAETFPRGS